MIRLKNLDSDIIASVMSCLFYKETTKETYIFYNFLKTLLNTDEVIDEVYLVYSAIDTLYELYSVRRDVPIINKEIVLSIIQQSLYAEIKEVFDPGFKNYARQQLGVELDSLNDQSVLTVGSHVFGRCTEFIDLLVMKGHTIEESRGYLSNLTQEYVDKLSEEFSQIILNLNNNDTRILDYQFTGWKKFLRAHKIYNGSKLPQLMRLVAAVIENKLQVAAKASDPLTSIGQLIALKEKYILYDEPIGYWDVEIMDNSLRVVPGTYTLVVGAAGVGKTTFGSWLAGNLLSQGKRIMFYCPEISEHMLLFTNILPAYVRAKYGFSVNVEQILGREPMYEHHDTLLSRKERGDLVKAAELSLAESGLFYHISKHFDARTLLDELRSEILKFEPDVIIFDHTTEVHGDENLNLVTQYVAYAIEAVKREFFVHIVALSHTGSNFRIPTKDQPIVTEKICNWSRRLEGVADNVVGMFRDGNKLNLFNTKSRWAPLFPMWMTLCMDREHNWFLFSPEDQLGSKLSLDMVDDFISDAKLYDLEEEDDEDDTFTFD